MQPAVMNAVAQAGACPPSRPTALQYIDEGTERPNPPGSASLATLP